MCCGVAASAAHKSLKNQQGILRRMLMHDGVVSLASRFRGMPSPSRQ